MISLILVAGIKRNKYFRSRKCRVYLGVKTCEVFLCFRAIIFLSCIVLTYQWRLCIYCFTSLVSFTGFQFTPSMSRNVSIHHKTLMSILKKRLHFVILEWHISHLKTKKRSKCCTYNRFPGPKSYRKTLEKQVYFTWRFGYYYDWVQLGTSLKFGKQLEWRQFSRLILFVEPIRKKPIFWEFVKTF